MRWTSLLRSLKSRLGRRTNAAGRRPVRRSALRPRLELLEDRVTPSSYNAATDFSLAGNPNGTWSYGWTQTEASPFNLDTERLDIPSTGIDRWRGDVAGAGNPAVYHNATNNVLRTNGTIEWPPGVLALHPGPDGEFAVVRWTAPTTADVSLDATFMGLDFRGQTSTFVHVLDNGVSIFNGSVNGYSTISATSFSSSSLSVTQGDRIDFIVGWGSANRYPFNTTALDATITPLSGPAGFTTLSSSLSTVNSEQFATITATVAAIAPATGTPTGTVQFQVDGQDIGGPVSLGPNGTASLTPQALSSLKGRSITAVYTSSDDNFIGSTGVLRYSAPSVNLVPRDSLDNLVTTVNEGETLQFDASVTLDPLEEDNPILTYSWTLPDGTSPVTGTPTIDWQFPDNGLYHASVTVTDPFAGSASDTACITASNLPPALDVSSPQLPEDPTQASIIVGQAITLNLTATDASPIDQTGTFTYDIDWGDNGHDHIVNDAQVVSDPARLSTRHGYTAPSLPEGYTITMTVVDKDGGVSDPPYVISGVVVTGPAPDVSITGPTSGVSGQSLTYTLSATGLLSTDPPTELVYHIDWDDGTPIQTIFGPDGTAVVHAFPVERSWSYAPRVTVTDDYGVSSLQVMIEPFQVQEGDLVAVGGTADLDQFVFTSGPAAGQVNVTRNDTDLGTFMVAGSVHVFGGSGHDTVTVNGTTGANAIDVAASSVTVDATAIVGDDIEAWVVNGTGGDTINVYGGTTTINSGGNNTFNVYGGSATINGGGLGANDTLVAAGDGPNAWQITGDGSGTLNGTTTFNEFENLSGGSNYNNFIFQNGGSISGLIDGGTGGVLDYSALTDGVTVNFQIGNVTPVADPVRILTGSFADINSVWGSNTASDNTIQGPDQGPDQVTTWGIGLLYSPDFGPQVPFVSLSNAPGAAFSRFQNLVGGSGNDTFDFFYDANYWGVACFDCTSLPLPVTSVRSIDVGGGDANGLNFAGYGSPGYSLPGYFLGLQSVTFFDDTGNVAFIIGVTNIHSDLDGVPDSVENAAPNGGDGNSDGIPDSQQANVTSLRDSAQDPQYVTLETPADTTLANVQAVDNPSPDNVPQNVSFPVGFLDFTIQVLNAGDATSLTLYLPQGVTATTYYQYGPTADDADSHWYEFLYDADTGTGAEILPDRVILHFVDGQRGDSDLSANGQIVDPGAPALSALQTPTITWVSPADIVYGTVLSSMQLSATADVPGTFDYGAAAGTILQAGNAQSLTVTFTPTDTGNYTQASASTTINVLKATPLLRWSTPAPITYGTPLGTTQLNATANVPGTFTFTPAAGTVLQAGNGQPLTVSFAPTDTTDYNPASASTTIDVTPAPTTTTLSAPAFTYGSHGMVAVTVTSSAGTPSGNVSLSVDGGTALSHALSGGTWTFDVGILGVGSHSLMTSYAAQGNLAASSGVGTLLVIPPASLSGTVFVDFNDDGQIDFGEQGIANVAVALTGTDDLGHAVNLPATTDADGAYLFLNLRPGSYRITETQPAAYPQGIDTLGTAGGSLAATDQFFVQLAQGVNGLNYNYGERPPATGSTQKGQSAGIGFWNNKNGQALIKALNGGTGTELADWLAATLPNMFGAHAGTNNLTGKSNANVAALFQQDFLMKGVKLDAQVLATALSVYATNATLDSTRVAVPYGFTVSGTGLSTATVNVGANGDAFGVANNTTMTVLDLLLATDAQAVNGILYNGNVTKRTKANNVYGAVNEVGNID